MRYVSLINNNQPLGKNSIKNIRFCAVANCSSAYWSCALAGSDRSVRPGINKNTQKGVFVYSGWSARIRTMIKRTKISCPTIRRRSKDCGYYICLLFFFNKKIQLYYFCNSFLISIKILPIRFVPLPSPKPHL